LGTKLQVLDFPYIKVKVQNFSGLLINFFLEEAIENGYHEIQAPLLVNEDTAYGTGQLPDKEGQMYHVTGGQLLPDTYSRSSFNKYLQK
jgi:seryl-tRNA synthetase